MKRLFLFSCALICASFFTSAQSVRLVAKTDSSFYSGAYVFIDSTHYGYSFGRSLLNNESAERIGVWSENLKWAPDEELFMQGSNSIRYSYQYDGDGLLTHTYGAGWNGVAWDTGSLSTHHYSNGVWDTSYVHEWVDGMGTTTPMSREIRTFGPDGLLTMELQLWNDTINGYENESKMTNTYTAGKLTEVYTTWWNGTSYMPYAIAEYSYNGDNMDTATNRYYNGGWINSSRSVYTYDVNNDVVLEEIQAFQNNTWVTTLKWHSTYDGDHNKLTQWEEVLTGGVWINTMMFQYTYTNTNLLETATTTEWDDVTAQFIPKQGTGKVVYYYEEFDPSGLSNTVKNNTTLQVFPNPATNNISIRSSTAHSAPFSITIFDATGRSVKHWNEPPSTFYQKQVDVSSLPSGSYFLRISDRPQEAVQFTIMK